MNSYIEPSYKILTKIFKENSYSSLAINQGELNNAITKIVYGVLEKNIELEYIINQLCTKKPQKSIEIIFKIAIYCILYMNAIPNFAIVNETVDFTKKIGKKGVSGFVNAVLKKVANSDFELPKEGDSNYFEIHYAKPQWFVDLLIKNFGKEKMIEILAKPFFQYVHIRPNTNKLDYSDLKNLLSEDKNLIRESNIGGFVCKNTEKIKKVFKKGQITYQSPSSMVAVEAMGVFDGASVLDLCSAPGGKSVFIAEKNPNSKIVACDIHPHRIELVKSYAKRMDTPNIETKLTNAINFDKEFEEKFDFVLVDAPCSCLGTFRKHQDVFLQHNMNSVFELAKIQKKILENAKKYVKKGGVLLFSTCTLTKEENDQNTEFVLNDSNFVLEEMKIPYKNNGTLQILPKAEWDGFYLAKFRNNG